MKEKNRFSLPGKIHPAVIAVWAALVAAAHLLPIPMPILGGGTFSLVQALSPLSGILFGPVAGALCSAVGGFVGNLVMPHTQLPSMGIFTFIIGAITAFTSGCIAWGAWPIITVNLKGNFIINGGIIVYLIGSILWFTQETGRGIPTYPLVYYGLGFAALVAGSIFARKTLAEKNHLQKVPAIWLCAFSGMIGGATIGNFFTLVLGRLTIVEWKGLIMLSPIERAAFSVVTAMIGAPLLAGLEKVRIYLGPQPEPPPNQQDPDISSEDFPPKADDIPPPEPESISESIKEQ